MTTKEQSKDGSHNFATNKFGTARKNAHDEHRLGTHIWRKKRRTRSDYENAPYKTKNRLFGPPAFNHYIKAGVMSPACFAFTPGNALENTPEHLQERPGEVSCHSSPCRKPPCDVKACHFHNVFSGKFRNHMFSQTVAHLETERAYAGNRRHGNTLWRQVA